MTQPHPQRCNGNDCVFWSMCRGGDYIPSCATHTPAAPAERLCDDCNIIELEEGLINLEQELKDARKLLVEPTTESCRTCSFMDVCSQEASASCERAIIDQIKQQARKAEREQVLNDVIAAIENQKDHKEFLLSRDTKDIVEDIVDSLRGGAK